MDDVVGRQHHADLLVHGHHHLVVHLHQVGVRLGGLVVDLLARGGQGGHEGDAFAVALQVVVAPLPLVASGLDGDVGVGGVLHRHDRLGGGQGHADDDQERDDGPDHLDGDAFVEGGRLRALGLAVLEHGVEHHPEHADEDHGAHDQHHPVQPVNLLGDLGDRLGQIELTHGGAAWHVFHCQGCMASEQGRSHQTRCGCLLPHFHLLSTQFTDSNLSLAGPPLPLRENVKPMRAPARTFAACTGPENTPPAQRSCPSAATPAPVMIHPVRPAPTAG